MHGPNAADALPVGWRRGVYLGLGANLGASPAHNILEALDVLDREPGLHVLRRSRLYRSPPWGPVPQPDYVNAVAEVATGLATASILRSLLDVERALGRRRDGPRFGPRTIDLDLLLDGDRVVDLPGVTVPHPRLAERAFVLVPLGELSPDAVVPGAGALRDLLAALGPESKRLHVVEGTGTPRSSPTA